MRSWYVDILNQPRSALNLSHEIVITLCNTILNRLRSWVWINQILEDKNEKKNQFEKSKKKKLE